MLRTALTLFLLAFSSILSFAQTVCAQNGNFTTFNPPTLTPFIHIDLVVDLPVNATTIWGISARVPNLGGNVTGALSGEVFPIGAAFETLPEAGNGIFSFYTNQVALNATSSASPTAFTSIVLNVQATLTYANEALHAFGAAQFSVADPAYLDLSFKSFVAEFEAPSYTGKGKLDIFELKTGGKRDGSPILALLPPGQGSA